MNIEVKKSIKIDVILGELKDLKEEVENKSDVLFVQVERRELIEILQDAINVIEVFVKKNKQLRDINKTLTDKITRKNNTISELGKQAKELNGKLFEVQKELDSCKNDTCNCCCKEKYESKEEIPTKEEMLKDLENFIDIIPVTIMLGIL